MYTRKPDRSVKKLPLKITSAVTAPEMTVSTSTQPHRLIGIPIACSVTPEEYKSMELIAKSCGSARIKKGQKTQPATAPVPRRRR